ncbi:hypothetical protein H3H36_07470 [Duganella sp. FT3S]|uniref:Uncharacterized protein n=1 Tax=Rugamonas fusca TaxID=2758568 RepID=A0A7W2EFT7_9BURK|nr:hypothetical protein [Rugamonas fusca]MBA5605197.1 hypothetical protein [Rugamonas fusca]
MKNGTYPHHPHPACLPVLVCPWPIAVQPLVQLGGRAGAVREAMGVEQDGGPRQVGGDGASDLRHGIKTTWPDSIKAAADSNRELLVPT